MPKEKTNQPNSLADLTLPAATDLEKIVLGSILLDGKRMEELAPILTADDFVLESHRRIYRCILEIHERGEIKIDHATVANELLRDGALDTIGGLSYLVDLDNCLPKNVNLDSYVRQLRDHTARRSIMRAAQMAIEAASLNQDSPGDILSRFETEVGLIERSLDYDAASARNPLQIVQDEGGLQQFLQKQTMGISSGFEDLDDLIYGIREGFYVLGAQTGVGKSALAGHMSLNLAKRGIPVLIHTLEMSRKQYLLRLAVSESNVPMWKIRRDLLNEEDRRQLRRALKEISDLPLYIDDTENMNIWDFERSVGRMVRRQGIQVAFADYLQIFSLFESARGAPRFMDERVAIVYYTRRLKLLSRRYHIPLFVLSQLHRRQDGKAKDNDPRPKLSDLHGSSSIEKDADVVLFLYREELVRPSAVERHGVAELIVAKSRDSPAGTVFLAYDKSFLRFGNLQDDKKKTYKGGME